MNKPCYRFLEDILYSHDSRLLGDTEVIDIDIFQEEDELVSIYIILCVNLYA